MKTFITFKKSLAALSIIALLASCATDDDYLEPTPREHRQDVVSLIENVNAELEETANPFQTRGWREWDNGRRAQLIAADFYGCYKGAKKGYEIGKNIDPVRGGIFGAIIGGVARGSYASWRKNRELDKKFECNDADITTVIDMCNSLAQKGYITDQGITNLDEILTGDSVVIDDELEVLSHLDDVSLGVGKMHNLALAILEGRIDGPVIDEGPEKYPNSKVTDEDVALQLNIIHSEELYMQCKQAELDVSEGKAIETDEKTNRIVKLFEEALTQYAEDSGDIALIIGKYCEIIDQAEDLTQEEKTELKATFATALYSAAYWIAKGE